ncbi:MAG: TIGR04283 family arsenosugar biosynthesis glycosyltransferase [Ginsengibacter sp.]
MQTISVVIPVFNEEKNIGRLVSFLLDNAGEWLMEIIVVDAESTDATCDRARQTGATVVTSPQKSRASQMNYGASLAKGSILYFIHADTVPPASYGVDIMNACCEGYSIGRYRTKFDSPKTILKLNAFFTRFDWFMCYGGDQTLFVTKSLFIEKGGFKEELIMMEDYEFVKRVRINVRYKIIPGDALVSARKYDTNSWLKVQLANKKMISMYKKGASQEEMINEYKACLHYR